MQFEDLETVDIKSQKTNATIANEKYIKQPLVSHPVGKALSGVFEVDGDKSISHRAVLFNAIANGSATVSNILEGEDVLNTLEVLKKCGVNIKKEANKTYKITGLGLRGLKQPDGDLYFGNSGTSARLFMGILAGQNFAAKLTGDKSLSRRDMKRITEPLTQMGAEFVVKPQLKTIHNKKDADKITLPITINGRGVLNGIEYKLPMASAQVKSAILLAGLYAGSNTKVVEREKSRDHTEIMLKIMGANIEVNDLEVVVNNSKQNQLKATNFVIPGDPSSAAFLVAAALLVKDSEVTIKNVCINPTRVGFYEVLKKMKANVSVKKTSVQMGEQIGDITAKYSPNMIGVELDSSIVPSMIDEFPIFSIIACFAEGRTKMVGLKELAAKESNRILTVANGLSSCGVSVNYNEGDYSLVVYGEGINKVLKTPKKPIQTELDHRIAMSFIIAGLKSSDGITVDDSSMIKTSFPAFSDLFTKLGGVLKV